MLMNRAFAAFVTLACSVSCISPAFSVTALTEPNLICATDSQDPIVCLDQEHKKQYSRAERLYAQERGLDTILYANDDGNIIMMLAMLLIRAIVCTAFQIIGKIWSNTPMSH